MKTVVEVGQVIDEIRAGKGAYEKFRCEECHWWKDRNDAGWGKCEAQHKRICVQIETNSTGFGIVWTRPDYACVGFTPKDNFLPL